MISVRVQITTYRPEMSPYIEKSVESRMVMANDKDGFLEWCVKLWNAYNGESHETERA